jgi:hypothetical protein
MHSVNLVEENGENEKKRERKRRVKFRENGIE